FSYSSHFYTLSLHDALPISFSDLGVINYLEILGPTCLFVGYFAGFITGRVFGSPAEIFSGENIINTCLGQSLLERFPIEFRYVLDRKSTRLNSSHQIISYAV